MVPTDPAHILKSQDVVTGVARFLSNQQDPHVPGYVRYSASGDLFSDHQKTNLAGSIFALKLYAMLGETDQKRIQPIVDRVLSFQRPDGSFADPYVCKKRFIRNTLSSLKHRDLSNLGNQSYIRAETRQAYSALLLHHVLPHKVDANIPTTPQAIHTFLSRLDWTRPWGAGSHFSHLLFFLSLFKKTKKLTQEQYLEARSSACTFIASLQHEDGAWYTGNPSHRQKVNGAMKVISGLIVDDLPFEHPKELINLCLTQEATQTHDACDQINQILVLRYSTRLLNHPYHQEDINTFCQNALIQWGAYYFPEHGGFSFHKHRANDRYYSAKVSQGLNEPDIHGTILFVWGLSMMKQLLQTENLPNFHEIKS
ncbi:hypothetical protein COV05_01820 [Candidatus Uhrbacteria bacterium CG10_big_fil_rev_8_21_14_0_10_48_16]|uniref:Squalene cyclase C-terminal domain-containing protein n=1 Tax=Candidatus Uhrbacteria bacterium CG10_big_fil_rev_8_21_14_0_10_48_16 TaxID=1975038 RepID=A0A2M8LHK3_9BACT|nr:MAG: hypothetical protein COV05_01820 [Candidatus Uhrbacteria bacterium CG10_big_fil_rev_8_21_14_0_10_48_16]